MLREIFSQIRSEKDSIKERIRAYAAEKLGRSSVRISFEGGESILGRPIIFKNSLKLGFNAVGKIYIDGLRFQAVVNLVCLDIPPIERKKAQEFGLTVIEEEE